MIRYALICDTAHEFDSWFPSAASFDEQVARGLVTCPACGSAKVRKGVMAPRIGKASGGVKDGDGAAPAAPPSAPAPVALLSEREQAVRAMLRAVREHVVSNADNVGRAFPDEARRMHYGETAHRSIYGEADAAEARALREEGIEVHPLPAVPDDRN